VDVVIKTKEGTPYGVLEIDSPVQHDYDHHDIDFLTVFANVLAEAVNTSKRNVTLQHAVDRAQDMLADRDRLLAAKNIVLDEKNALLCEEKRLLEEKGVLGQELQHRVRNNLQLVHGMLSQQLQINTIEAAKDGVNAIARRIMTLAQVYKHLFGTGLSRTIDFGGYLGGPLSKLSRLGKCSAPQCRTDPSCGDGHSRSGQCDGAGSCHLGIDRE
jgi:hypothetical protein